MYKHVAHGIAGKFSDETMEHIFAHSAVEKVDADCVITLNEPDEEIDKDSLKLNDPGIMNALKKARAKGVKEMDGGQTGTVWGLDRIDQVDYSSPGTDVYTYGPYTGAGSLIYGAHPRLGPFAALAALPAACQARRKPAPPPSTSTPHHPKMAT